LQTSLIFVSAGPFVDWCSSCSTCFELFDRGLEVYCELIVSVRSEPFL
jgi:hypothetical protein